MITAEIRKPLHQYIDNADDKSIEAIYTILKPSMQTSLVTIKHTSKGGVEVCG